MMRGLKSWERCHKFQYRGDLRMLANGLQLSQPVSLHDRGFDPDLSM
jgi:hypothetical protein